MCVCAVYFCVCVCESGCVWNLCVYLCAELDVFVEFVYLCVCVCLCDCAFGCVGVRRS